MLSPAFLCAYYEFLSHAGAPDMRHPGSTEAELQAYMDYAAPTTGGFNDYTVARIDHHPTPGPGRKWYVWEYGLQQQEKFDTLAELLAYYQRYPLQLTAKPGEMN